MSSLLSVFIKCLIWHIYKNLFFKKFLFFKDEIEDAKSTKNTDIEVENRVSKENSKNIPVSEPNENVNSSAIQKQEEPNTKISNNVITDKSQVESTRDSNKAINTAKNYQVKSTSANTSQQEENKTSPREGKIPLYETISPPCQLSDAVPSPSLTDLVASATNTPGEFTRNWL